MSKSIHCCFYERFVLIVVATCCIKCVTGQTRNNDVVHDVTVKETEPVGHVIANLTLSGNCNVTSYTPSRSDRYFSMIESVLTLKEELDLDAGLQIQNNQIGVSVFEVKSKMRDLDIPADVIEEFRLDQYLISQYDGRRYFAINSSTGVIESRNTIDYDTMGRTKFLMLKIVAVDVDGQKESTTLNITIMDVDDLPSRFLRKPCDDVTTTCDVTIYTAEMDRHFQGSLDVRPVHVPARDGDVGLNYDVTYTIEPDDGVVDINNFTGVLTVMYGNMETYMVHPDTVMMSTFYDGMI
ncbi:protocadherin Fat 2-like isoform X2 [Dreissena polymorpha]|uniref:protocadherin Fat 2-like isoform X2 n=1 Tax=Dreissena polymorpha TaxID=45954 RepID=UPI002264C6B0|nr:protocadherin Fat 2-like isoform X2 [Dreissena polymorpha]